MCRGLFPKEYFIALISLGMMMSASCHDESEFESKNTDSDDDSMDAKTIVMIILLSIGITILLILIKHRCQQCRKKQEERLAASENVNSFGISMTQHEHDLQVLSRRNDNDWMDFPSDIVINATNPNPTGTMGAMNAHGTNLGNWQFRRVQLVSPVNEPVPRSGEIGIGTPIQDQFTYDDDSQIVPTTPAARFQNRRSPNRGRNSRSSSMSSTQPEIYSIPDPDIVNSRASWLNGNDIKRSNPIYDEDEPPPSYSEATGGASNSRKDSSASLERFQNEPKNK